MDETIGHIHATDTTSTHPAYNDAPVRVTQFGYPPSDPSTWMEVELLEDWAGKAAGTRLTIRRRDFIAEGD